MTQKNCKRTKFISKNLILKWFFFFFTFCEIWLETRGPYANWDFVIFAKLNILTSMESIFYSLESFFNWKYTLFTSGCKYACSNPLYLTNCIISLISCITSCSSFSENKFNIATYFVSFLSWISTFIIFSLWA